ncbi:DUF4400 domain-containing protein (plasmid) [Vibrio scophthalmi]|uniref:DUF4400 domain-containing protein n=1 Tax=Vibrio scophthalmi TaxID=45658 RepID=UPI003EBEE274
MAHNEQSFIDETNKLIYGKGTEFQNRWIHVCFLIFFFSLLYAWFWLSPQDFRAGVVNELNLLSQTMTPEQAEAITLRVNEWYASLMVTTGISDRMDEFYSSATQGSDGNDTVGFLGLFFERFVDNSKLWIYRSLLRLNTLMEWMVLGSVLIFAFTADAYYNYQRRIDRFAKQNIKFIRLILKSMFIFFLLLWIYLVVPLIDGDIWRYLPLTFIAIVTVALTTIIKDFQRF